MRTVLVTGGNRGIGEEICNQFQHKGYRVLATYRNLDSNPEGVKLLQKKGIMFYQLDITDYQACTALYEKLRGEGIVVDTLVNNAGITADSTLRKMEPEQWLKVIDTNLIGAINMTKAFLTGMLEVNFGRIINISSINGLKGQFGQCNYSASKAGLIGFTKSLALEVATKGITVNAVSPGYIKTEMTGAMKESVLGAIIEQIPMKRMGSPKEIAHSILFIADEQSSFLSGENLNVNGAQF